MRKNRRVILYGGLLALGLGLLTMLPAMIKFNGFFMIRGDYVNQTVTRLINSKLMFKDGALSLWNWKNFLGTSYTGLVGTVLSFNSICMLFPEKLMPYAATLAMLLRWFVMGMTSTAFVRRFVNKNESALIGSLLYCFSGYAMASLEFTAFYNTMAVFPLLLIALEKRFTEDNYRWLMIPAAAINLLASSYLFIGSSIAMLIYALSRYFAAEEWRSHRKFKFISLCLLEYLIGALICGFTISNFVGSMLSTSRSTVMLSTSAAATGSLRSLIIPKYFFDELAGIFLPAASNRVTAFYSSTNWYSMQAYLPVFGFALCFAAMIMRGKKKDGLSLALVLLLIFSFFPIFNNTSSFYANSYTRWWYALTLVMAVITSKVYDGLDDESVLKSAKRGLVLQWCAVIILPVIYYAVYFMRDTGISALRSVIAVFFNHNYEYGFAEDVFRIYSVAAAVLMTGALTAIVLNKKVRKFTLPILIACIALYGTSFVILNNSDAPLFREVYHTRRTEKEYKDLYSVVEKYYLQDNPVNTTGKYSYRVDYPAEFLPNYAAVIDQPGIGYFESTIDTDAARFAVFAGMGEDSDVYYYPHDNSNELRTLLSVKYFYNYFPDDETVEIPEGFVFSRNESNVDIYENTKYLPFGFAYDDYITESELSAFEDAHVGTLLHTLVIEDADAEKVSALLAHCEDLRADIDEDIAARSRCTSTEFEADSHGFTAQFDNEKNEVVFFSVPYDEGWHAYIDGSPVELIRANLGFFAMVVPAGQHNVVLKYDSGTILPGICVTCFGVAAAAAYVMISRSNRKKAASSKA